MWELWSVKADLALAALALVGASMSLAILIGCVPGRR